jgi:hypothetical protein
MLVCRKSFVFIILAGYILFPPGSIGYAQRWSDWSGGVSYFSDEAVTGFQVINDDYSSFPGQTWVGEQIRFEPIFRSGRRYLRQMGDPTQTSHFILTRTSVYYGEWKFSVIFDGFTSSNQNRIWIWLMADDDEIPVGYGIRIGENGSQKFVRLFRLRGELPPVEVLQSQVSMSENGDEIRVHVRRDPSGTWHLGLAPSMNQDFVWSSVQEMIPAQDVVYWFGFRTHFTSTRADKFLFGPVEVLKYPVFVRIVEVLSAERLRITVSEPTQSLQDISVRINGEVANGWITANGFEAILNLREPLPGGTYSIKVEGLYDNISGQEINSPATVIRILDPPDRFDVVINEFLSRPTTGSTPVFVELFNRSDKLIDLTGWSFCRSTGNWTIGINSGANRILQPGAYIVLTPNPGYFNQKGINNTLLLPISTPLRTQDRFCLKSPEGNLIDTLAYNSSWSSIFADGISLERKDYDYIGMDINNWQKFGNLNTNHSAGSVNHTYEQLNEPLRILFGTERSTGDIELLFSHFVDINRDTEIYLNQSRVMSANWSIWAGNRIIIPLRDSESQRIPLQIDLSDVGIVGSSQRTTLRHEIGRIPEVGNLIINEIMYQPIQDRYATFPDQSEYVEIRNLAPFRVSLEDIFLHDTPDKDGVRRTWIPENRSSWWIEANGNALLIADTSRSLPETRTARFFGNQPDHSWARVNRSTLGLTSGGRGVYLATNNSLLDSVYYSPDWHHPLLVDPRGISLEFIGTSLSGNNNRIHWGNVSRFWTSSVHPLGGTPGQPNSVGDVSAEAGPQEDILSITPNPFSPDQDGNADLTRVVLNLPKPGYVVRIRIYDRRGVHLQTLQESFIAGKQFETTWNGVTASRTLADTGVYLIVAELLDPDNGRLKTHVKPVVLVRASSTRHRF